ncbi:hypothetical protein [Nocardioides dongkuii]|uniref:hypothetical protein n=1 Tax=Nocardioides dongkuii TaxID=2760089 RepID=UPI0015F9247F|nr:hypothetical protein [Nocardioides dongkuii]
MDLWRRAHLAAWLAPVVGAIVAVYRATHESGEGLYAGAEPVAAGVLMAAPFVVLTLAQAGRSGWPLRRVFSLSAEHAAPSSS